MHEPIGSKHGRQFRAQDFERDLPVVLEILREIDGGHTAIAEATFDPVAIGGGRGKAGADVGRG